ncbi:TIGR02391 family protein [Gulosibacter sp. ACHW.36C]|uniref:TIGR02391 family protein n=1 Tax=Gulosibacter sediminis TaxID=1729695 RepID=A0ABY4MYW2_9MICO|nr:TIGR02391 family protein [Gulosibacter sediminis]UQN14188.1 TIGR02391 family protein [Gulosibacter sediminis]
MTGVNLDWVVDQLDIFIELTKGHWEGNPEDVGVWWVVEGDEDSIKLQLPVVERILDRYLPGWQKEDLSYDREDPQEQVWAKHRNLALRARGIVDREDEVRKNLGDDAPEISAANLHPWVWSGAQSLWRSGHYRSAVEDAAKKLNAEIQNKLGRRDVSETDLFKQTFSLDSPVPGKPRLRRMKDDGSDTYKSMQRGAMALAEGFYAGIRNPFNHEDPRDIDEQIGLEYLAALSVLARWVDESTLEVAS